MEEREIDLISLLFHVLLHWRSLIVAGVIGAILVGRYGFFATQESDQSIVEKVVDADETPKTNKADNSELLNLDDENMSVYLRAEESYNSMLSYLDSLEYMKLDGDNISKTVVTVGVKGDKQEDTDAIAAVCCRSFKDGGYWDYVNGKTSLSSSDIELFVAVVSSGSTSPVQMYDPGKELSGYNLSIITVISLGRNEEESQELADMAVDFFAAEKDSIAGDLGEYEMMVLNKNTKTGYDSSVMTIQNDKLTALYKLYDEMAKRKKALTEDQLKFLALGEEGAVMEEGSVSADDTELISEETASKSPAPVSSMSTGEKIRFSLKYIMIGLCAGIFCMAGLWSVLYIMNNRIKPEDPIEKLFKVAVVGVIPAAYGKKRVFEFVDSWIISIRDRNKRIFSVDEAVSLIVSRVKVQSSKDKVSKLVFIGCDLGKNVPDIPGTMAEKLNAGNISTSVLDNVLYDPENTEKLGEMDGAVIIEKAGKTLYSEFTEEIELLKRQQIKLLGCVIVE